MVMATPPRVSPAGSPQVRLAPEEEEPPADPVDPSVQDAPARLRHRSEEQTELPDEAGEYFVHLARQAYHVYKHVGLFTSCTLGYHTQLHDR